PSLEVPSHHLDPPSFPTRRSSDLRSKPGSRSNAMAVHPPPNDRSCDLPVEPAPVRYSHGTREGRLTVAPFRVWRGSAILVAWGPDRKSTRLNSSHVSISYAVFCLK